MISPVFVPLLGADIPLAFFNALFRQAKSPMTAFGLKQQQPIFCKWSMSDD